jgi:hypothetical protein
MINHSEGIMQSIYKYLYSSLEKAPWTS